MNSEVVVSVDGLTKKYWSYTHAAYRLLDWISPFSRRHGVEREILSGISFELRQGQAIALIGDSGVGKSTLLKCIAGIIESNSGKICVKGIMCPMLQLKGGINPNLSGRENIYYLAALHGFQRGLVSGQLAAIIDFSELENKVDEPVWTYSSGMIMRLAFSVYVHLKPDILLIDETLSVGDARFQEKCLRRLHDLLAEGVALILVSHNLQRIKQFCNQALWLDNGRVKMLGDVNSVVQSFESHEVGLGLTSAVTKSLDV
ncbi:MAG: ABC transporter ATP-binding protein [Proteobacteria bacterium]|nr:ABC transporter ATP-binding protein [Pseudomonadota bacterium]MBU0966583.1 ABC transporter ATP-binding protein [Pseudomonadota bacterium]